MFSTNVRSGKAYAVEQKIRELKKAYSVLRVSTKKNNIRVKPNDIIRKATSNINKTPSKKYRIEPNSVERERLLSETFKMKLDFHRFEKVKKNNKTLTD